MLTHSQKLRQEMGEGWKEREKERREAEVDVARAGHTQGQSNLVTMIRALIGPQLPSH